MKPLQVEPREAEGPETAVQPVSDVSDFDSVAIRRLIDEVRGDEPALVGGRYDRTYHRHNR